MQQLSASHSALHAISPVPRMEVGGRLPTPTPYSWQQQAALLIANVRPLLSLNHLFIVSQSLRSLSRQHVFSPLTPTHHPLPVSQLQGAWNNFEGLPGNYSSKIHDVLALHDSTYTLPARPTGRQEDTPLTTGWKPGRCTSSFRTTNLPAGFTTRARQCAKATERSTAETRQTKADTTAATGSH